MNADPLKRRIYDALKGGYFDSPDDLVDVSDGTEGCAHIVIVSRKLDHMSYGDKEDLLWRELSERVSEEDQRRVTLLVGVSPEEVKAY
jgi:hypothetical protein